MKYSGIDMACKSSAVCITGEDGKIVSEFEVPTDEDGFRTGLSRWDDLFCVIEASPLAEWVARILEDLGHKVVVIDPRRAKAVICTKKKTDKLDARNLAKMGRTGWYTAVHRKSPAARLLRTHMQARAGLVQTGKAQAARIRGLLRAHGIKLGKVSEGGFANKVRAMIMKRQPELLPILEPLLSILLQAKIEAKKMKKEIRRLSARDEVCAQLMTAPGVGPLVVSAYVATIDDPKRFPSGDEIAAYIGLVPSVHQSGDTEHRGRITKEGDGLLRTLLVEAANVLLTRTKRDFALKRWGLALQKEKGVGKARVAVARKLAVLLHHMWMTGEKFDWAKA